MISRGAGLSLSSWQAKLTYALQQLQRKRHEGEALTPEEAEKMELLQAPPLALVYVQTRSHRGGSSCWAISHLFPIPEGTFDPPDPSLRGGRPDQKSLSGGTSDPPRPLAQGGSPRSKVPPRRDF